MMSRRSKARSKILSFKVTWRDIIKPVFFAKEDQINIPNQTDNFFKERPYEQSFLTFYNNCTNKNINWENFTQRPIFDVNSLDDCFHGVLNYTFTQSECQLNINELEFHYSRANFRPQYNPASTDPTVNCDISCIFDYNNINTNFYVPQTEASYIGVTFNNIQINPLSYSIRSNISLSHLTSFTFEAFDEDCNNWVVLDERANNDQVMRDKFPMYYVRLQRKSFSSFKIKQTEPANRFRQGFYISAFDIFGDISLRTTKIKKRKSSISDSDSSSDTSEFDICKCRESLFD